MPLKTHFEELPPLNLTAMLDIVFLLVIFFAVNTRFLDEERQIGMQVPAVADRSTPGVTPDRKVINVYRDGTITLDQKPVSLEELTRGLAEARNRSGKVGVLVRGDAHGELQEVAAVLMACRRAGIADMGIAVRHGTIQK